MQAIESVISSSGAGLFPVPTAWLAAAVSGLYTASWGAFKDGPFESFRGLTFPRSILFSIGLLALLYVAPPVAEPVRALSLAQLFLLVMGLERTWSEIYKWCFRRPRHEELFNIPQLFTFFGRTVRSPVVRLPLGVALTTALCLGACIEMPIRSRFMFVLVAFCTGLGVSVGGAYKDAPFEGFQPLKFFRSSIVLAIVSPLLFHLGPQRLGFLVFTYVGIERMLIEYYKSFIIGSVPGKFRADLPIIEGPFLTNRHLFRQLATAIVVFVGGLYVFAVWR